MHQCVTEHDHRKIHCASELTVPHGKDDQARGHHSSSLMVTLRENLAKQVFVL